MDVKSLPGMGVAQFVFEGLVQDKPRERINEDTGETSYAVEVAYFGGKQYIKLSNPDQRTLIKPGSWCRFECSVRQFKDNCYAGPGVLTHVDTKPVATIKAAG